MAAAVELRSRSPLWSPRAACCVRVWCDLERCRWGERALVGDRDLVAVRLLGCSGDRDEGLSREEDDEGQRAGEWRRMALHDEQPVSIVAH